MYTHHHQHQHLQTQIQIHGGDVQGELANDTVLGESQPSNVLTLANLDAKRTDFSRTTFIPHCG